MVPLKHVNIALLSSVKFAFIFLSLMLILRIIFRRSSLLIFIFYYLLCKVKIVASIVGLYFPISEAFTCLKFSAVNWLCLVFLVQIYSRSVFCKKLWWLAITAECLGLSGTSLYSVIFSTTIDCKPILKQLSGIII